MGEGHDDRGEGGGGGGGGVVRGRDHDREDRWSSSME